jgi:hypothetical protein
MQKVCYTDPGSKPLAKKLLIDLQAKLRESRRWQREFSRLSDCNNLNVLGSKREEWSDLRATSALVTREE